MNSVPFYPEHIYYQIVQLNHDLPNVQKWTLTSSVLYDVCTEPYNSAKKYEISLSIYEFGQLYELRKIIPLFYRHVTPDKEILQKIRGDTALDIVYNFGLICTDGFAYNSHNPLFLRGYQDEVEKDINNDKEIPEDHFHLIPFPQRCHMVLGSRIGKIWVLAFILEGFQYEFVENDEEPVSSSREGTHQYFQFYAKYICPSKTELINYQEMRMLMGEHFVEIPETPKPTPSSPPKYEIHRFLSRQYDYEPKWWESV